VTTIGESTYGKYTASITFKPEDFLKDERGNGYYDSPADYKNFDNWGVQPIVLRYANSQGVTDFKDGFCPLTFRLKMTCLPEFRWAINRNRF
jgi:carboxyl-terminal processing protease